MADGYTGSCKMCIKHRKAEYFVKNRERLLSKDREYYHINKDTVLPRQKVYRGTEKGKEVAAASEVKWRLANPLKALAISTLNHAKRTNKISESPCEVCQNPKVHGHHDDYNKPLEVRWLCSTHHIEWHKENGPGLNG